MIIKNENYCLGDFNFLEDVKKMVDMPTAVSIYDLTLREGNQTPGCVMRKEEQIAIAIELDKLGVDFIEFFPAVSKDDEWVVNELVSNNMLKHAKVSALVRPRTIDMELAIKTHAQHIFLEGAGNMITAGTMNYKSVDEIIQSFVDTIKVAHDHGMTVTACPWDIGKVEDISVVEKWVRALAEAGAEDICYADTFGYTLPWTTHYMIKKYREWAGPDTIISCHFHNDYGLATASTLAAVAAGAKRVQVGFNNLGERAGNAAIDEVALNLEVNMGIKSGINLASLYPLSKKIGEITKKPVGGKKPVTGEETFMMGSGIIVEALSRLAVDGNENCFLPFRPELVGQPPFTTVYGKGAGRNMIKRFVQKMNLEATEEQIQQILLAVKEESMLIKNLISEFRVEQIVKETLKK
ncbi:hypothetical protein Ami103574_14280 [Aminipila butyrica]|uniref:Pyruvate carboxyltransferase domain-containing protein n=1 Tax=Aminipila butyrica TaxID=433296 RepID=A0A858C1H7_9FIRM|nr:LeuA family protein [Aminipila butyrica]QIB70386.1 hypothetical protein Ami103574_14280 [Aminipila butyrica]